ncbi:MAG TPA: MaoC family dehydratase N-terminal domain-containing protein [Solirubrobacteraceae bacterium]|jgi:acyl dehydratase|nr:MaoC family dehydratase N-terminal domain-containing protein [Solirubrobacteraceae bacterium]
MPADASLIGTELGVERFPLDRSKLRELAIAVQDEDPIALDGRAVPLNWPVLVQHWRPKGSIAEALGLDLRRVVHGEVRWEYLAPVGVGEEITARRWVAGVTSREGKRGGTMTLVSVQIDFTRADGTPVARQTDTIIETAG